MATKFSTPVSILAFFYLLIVGLSVIIVLLSGLAAYDVHQGMKKRNQVFAANCCRVYLEHDRYEDYYNCYTQSMEQIKK